MLEIQNVYEIILNNNVNTTFLAVNELIMFMQDHISCCYFIQTLELLCYS